MSARREARRRVESFSHAKFEKLRLKKDCGLVALGKAIGVSTSLVGTWSSPSKPNPDQLRALAKALRCTQGELCDG